MAGTVVVLGGGTGGLVAARRLRRLLGPRGDRVVLVDRDLTYRFAPSFLWVMSGARRPGQITANLAAMRRHGIEILQADVLEIDTDSRSVKTTETALTYDRLVLALGAELARRTRLYAPLRASHSSTPVGSGSISASHLHQRLDTIARIRQDRVQGTGTRSGGSFLSGLPIRTRSRLPGSEGVQPIARGATPDYGVGCRRFSRRPEWGRRSRATSATASRR